MTDSEIIRLYWQRSEQAIAASREQYGSYCHTIAWNILGNAQDSEECVSDTWLQAWNTIPPHYPRRLAAFLGRITRNLALNRVRDAGTEKRGGGQAALALAELEECVPATENVAQTVEDAEILRVLERFLRTQPEQKRNIFIRRYWYMTPVRQLAADYRMSESKAAALLHRMRMQLRAELEREGIAL